LARFVPDFGGKQPGRFLRCLPAGARLPSNNMRLFALHFSFLSRLLLGCVFAILIASRAVYADHVAGVSAHHPMPVKLQLNWNHQYQFGGFYAALAQGYYREAGLDVTIQSWKPGLKVVDEVVAGRADFGVGYGALVADYAKGAPISLLMASFQFSPMVLLSHEPIYDLAQLSGKKVMHFGNLQVFGLLNKARAVVTEPVIEIPSSGDLNDFIDHKVDLYGAFVTNEPHRLQAAGVPYYTLDPKAYGVQSYGDLLITSQHLAQMRPEVVQAFKQATIKGWEYALAHPQAVVDYILAHYSVVKTRDALLAEARATSVYVKTGDVPIGHVEVTKLMATAASAKEVGLITQSDFDRLQMDAFVFDSKTLLFTPAERDYLAQHPVIKLANDIAWEPFEFVDDRQRYRGIAADYFQLFSKKLGIRFEPLTDQNWAQTVELAQQGELDLFSCAVPTPERQQYMHFTQPYLSFPMVLAARSEVGFVDRYDQLEGYTIAAVKGYWSEEYLRANFPNITVLSVDSIKEGLDAVIEGRAFGYIGNLAAINFAIRKYGAEGIRIVGQFDERFELAIGVRHDDPVLFGIMEKVLASVTEQERQTIFNRWIQLEMVNKLDQKQLLEVLLPVGLVILGLLGVVGFYAFQKRQQKKYIREIYELSLATEVDLKTHRILWSSASFAQLSGYSVEELKGMDYLQLAGDSIDTALFQHIYQRLAQGQNWQGEMRGRTRQGGFYWVELTLSPKKDILGRINCILATRINITDKKRVEALSVTDELTGLYNRRYYNEVLARELKGAQRQKRPLALAMLDIDHFKGVNDLYGHQRGDELLKVTAKQIQQAFHRANDYVFRIGGEEFMALAYFEDRAEFEVHLKQLIEQMQALQIENKASPFGVLTLSIGALYLAPEAVSTASASGPEWNVDNLFRAVDKKLYEAKSQGRNRVLFYDSDTPLN
jgi:diguanylate cyclase (GGDEF)-like protein/PAS domain S-box-containing protein